MQESTLMEKMKRSSSQRSKHSVTSRSLASLQAPEPPPAAESLDSLFNRELPSFCSLLEGLDFIDITPVSVIQREPNCQSTSTFENLVYGECGCSLFTKGYISTEPEVTANPSIPIIIEIDMRHPIVDANL